LPTFLCKKFNKLLIFK